MKDIIPSWARERGDIFRRDFDTAFANIQKDLDNLYGNFLGGLSGFKKNIAESEKYLKSFVPSVDIVENDKEITVKAELPGLDAKNVEVSHTDDSLTIQGEKKEEKKTDKDEYHLLESAYGSFKRVIGLPQTVDLSKLEAHFQNGILTIKVPKKADAQKASKKVDIKTS
ncbi:MAG: Hsp20/alpha crystallin family protein [Leptospiraceae bacterium]|nr:Hsp20/alpha crystallin family protein [Leptospiraceae bacterium]MCK6379684.1 Hsp20/alpha crystallin family protein [Leptospiraceae bacterium]NUM41575.1 Hsp20/alpha crystallin family protein [Leptospiraceae bacterium]